MDPPMQIFVVKIIVYGFVAVLCLTIAFWILDCMIHSWKKKKSVSRVNVQVNRTTTGGNHARRTIPARMLPPMVSSFPTDPAIFLGAEQSAEPAAVSIVSGTKDWDVPPPTYEECMRIDGQKFTIV